MGKITAKEMHARLREYLRCRSDLGLWNATQATVLEPRGPFESRPARKPKRWFVLFLVFTTILMGAVAYFNFWS